MPFIETIAKLSRELPEEKIKSQYKEIVNSLIKKGNDSQIAHPDFNYLNSLVALEKKLSTNVKLNKDEKELLTEFAKELAQYLPSEIIYYTNASLISSKMGIISERYYQTLSALVTQPKELLPTFQGSAEDKQTVCQSAVYAYVSSIEKLLENDKVKELSKKYMVITPKSLEEAFENKPDNSHSKILNSLTVSEHPGKVSGPVQSHETLLTLTQKFVDNSSSPEKLAAVINDSLQQIGEVMQPANFDKINLSDLGIIEKQLTDLTENQLTNIKPEFSALLMMVTLVIEKTTEKKAMQKLQPQIDEIQNTLVELTTAAIAKDGEISKLLKENEELKQKLLAYENNSNSSFAPQ